MYVHEIFFKDRGIIVDFPVIDFHKCCCIMSPQKRVVEGGGMGKRLISIMERNNN